MSAARALAFGAFFIASCSEQEPPKLPEPRASARAPDPSPPDEEEICRAAIAREEAWRAAKSLWPACPRSFVSPDGRWELFTLHSEGKHGIRVRLRDRRAGAVADPIRVTELDFPSNVSWAPTSEGFFVNDSQGSGQSNYLRYFSIEGRRVAESRALHRTATNLYRRLFECTDPRTYLYVEGQGWWRSERLVTIRVWSSHHSVGCPLDPISGNELILVGDPLTGRLYRNHRALRASVTDE